MRKCPSPNESALQLAVTEPSTRGQGQFFSIVRLHAVNGNNLMKKGLICTKTDIKDLNS